MFRPVSDPDKLNHICAFINDMLAGSTDVIATPSDQKIAWKRAFPGKGEYEVTQNEAFMRLTHAGYNPKQLVEFAIDKFDPPKEDTHA